MHLDDLSDMECERLFRLVNCIICIARLCQCRNCTSCFRNLLDIDLVETILHTWQLRFGFHKSTSAAKEAMLIMLRRLSYPNRLSDLVPLFSRSEYELSLIFNKASCVFVLWLYTFGPIEGRWHDAFMLSASSLSNKLQLIGQSSTP